MSWLLLGLVLTLVLPLCWLAIWALCRMLAPQTAQEWREEDDVQAEAVRK